MRHIHLYFAICAAILSSACAPDQFCYRNEDCASPKVCKTDGTCGYICTMDVECGRGFACESFQCVIKHVEPDPDPCADGSCDVECQTDDACGEGFLCKEGKCTPKPSPVPTCPEGMALIEKTYCMDKYEASRPDATAEDMGVDDSKAESRAGVIPWRP